MTKEEKARRYDEAIKVIKDNLDALNEITETGAEVVNIQSIKNCFYKAFPEIKKSEDERIRNWLIGYFHQYKDDGMEKYANGLKVESILTWLEKQGDKSVNIDIESIVDLYKQRLKSQGVIENSPLVNMCLTSFRRGVEIILEKLNLKKFEKQGEQKATDEVKPKYKVGDWITIKE